MHTLPVSLASARSGRFRLILTLALAMGALPACSGDDPPPPPAPGVARLEVVGAPVEPGVQLLFRCVAEEPRGGPLTYDFDWGAGGDVAHVPEAAPSGTPVEREQAFFQEGTYQARCRALDAEGHEGPWSAGMGYTISRSASERPDARVQVYGRGRVTSTPAGLDCTDTCQFRFKEATAVTLDATPEPGWRFVGWWGCDEKAEPYTFVVDRDVSCMARFAPEAESAAEWRRTGARSPTAPEWSPDGTRVAALDTISASLEPNRLRIWDVASGRLLRTIDAGAWRRSFLSVAWSPRADVVALGRRDGSLTLVDATTGAVLREWRAHTNDVSTLAWSPDGRRLATTGDTGMQVMLWTADTGAGQVASRTQARVRRLLWSPDGRRLALKLGSPGPAGSEWVEIHGTTGSSADEVHTDVSSVAWSPDGQRYAVGGEGQVRVYDTFHVLQSTWSGTWSRTTLLDWSADGKWLAVGDPGRTLVVLAADTGAVVAESHESGPPVLSSGGYDGLRFHPTKGELAVVEDLPAEVTVVTVDAQAHALRKRELLPHTVAVEAVAWSPSGERLASGGREGRVQLWDKQGASVLTLAGHGDKAVRALAWDGSSARLASGGADGQARVWLAEDGSLVRAFQHATGGETLPIEVHRVALSPDGQRLATYAGFNPASAAGGTVRVWNVETGTEVFRFPRDDRSVRTLAWTPEGRYLVAAYSDVSWELWDAQTGELRLVDPGVDTQTLAVALHPDGTRLALGTPDGLLVRDLQTGAARAEAFGGFTPYALAWSADGTRIAGGGVGGLVFVWEVSTHLASRVLGFHAGNVNTVSWRPDGKVLTTGGTDFALSTWRFAP